MYNFIHVHVNVINSLCNCPYAHISLSFIVWKRCYTLLIPPFSLIFLLGVYRHRPAGVDGQWQRPEISSNLGEDLSLADPIDPNLLPQQQERRSQRWKDAHCKSCCYDNTMCT